MKNAILNFILTTMVFISGCGNYENHDDSEGHGNIAPGRQEPVSSRPVTANPPPVDPCAGKDPAVDDSLVRYTVQRNSKLDQRTYTTGENLVGRFYIASYVVSKGACDDTGSTHRLYEDDIKGVWLEISQMRPYDPTFVKTYFVPEEAMSFVDDSLELGIIINPEFLVIDRHYTSGNDYLIRLQVENKTGVVNSSGTWHNDIEAFNVMGFSVQNVESGQVVLDSPGSGL